MSRQIRVDVGRLENPYDHLSRGLDKVGDLYNNYHREQREIADRRLALEDRDRNIAVHNRQLAEMDREDAQREFVQSYDARLGQDGRGMTAGIRQDLAQVGDQVRAYHKGLREAGDENALSEEQINERLAGADWSNLISQEEALNLVYRDLVAGGVDPLRARELAAAKASRYTSDADLTARAQAMREAAERQQARDLDQIRYEADHDLRAGRQNSGGSSTRGGSGPRVVSQGWGESGDTAKYEDQLSKVAEDYGFRDTNEVRKTINAVRSYVGGVTDRPMPKNFNTAVLNFMLSNSELPKLLKNNQVWGQDAGRDSEKLRALWGAFRETSDGQDFERYIAGGDIPETSSPRLDPRRRAEMRALTAPVGVQSPDQMRQAAAIARMTELFPNAMRTRALPQSVGNNVPAVGAGSGNTSPAGSNTDPVDRPELGSGRNLNQPADNRVVGGNTTPEQEQSRTPEEVASIINRQLESMGTDVRGGSEALPNNVADALYTLGRLRSGSGELTADEQARLADALKGMGLPVDGSARDLSTAVNTAISELNTERGRDESIANEIARFSKEWSDLQRGVSSPGRADRNKLEIAAAAIERLRNKRGISWEEATAAYFEGRRVPPLSGPAARLGSNSLSAL